MSALVGIGEGTRQPFWWGVGVVTSAHLLATGALGFVFAVTWCADLARVNCVPEYQGFGGLGLLLALAGIASLAIAVGRRFEPLRTGWFGAAATASSAVALVSIAGHVSVVSTATTATNAASPAASAPTASGSPVASSMPFVLPITPESRSQNNLLAASWAAAFAVGFAICALGAAGQPKEAPGSGAPSNEPRNGEGARQPSPGEGSDGTGRSQPGSGRRRRGVTLAALVALAMLVAWRLARRRRA